MQTCRHVLLLIVLGCAALTAAEQKKGAFFNPRVSSRSIAFNQVVRVVFTTIPTQLPEVDIATTVRSALELPDVQDQWRLVQEPTVSVHERLNTIEVAFVLQPREVGPLPLPSIPVRWLEGDQMAQFGTVAVADEIRIGDETRPLPLELTTVAGFPWSTTPTQLQERIGAGRMQELPEEDRTIFNPTPDLTIVCTGPFMHKVRITTTGIDLTEARSRFVGRWGHPTADQTGATPPRLVWVLGWLRISATAARTDAGDPAILLELVREDVSRKLLSKQLQENVFDLLDGDLED